MRSAPTRSSPSSKQKAAMAWPAELRMSLRFAFVALAFIRNELTRRIQAAFGTHFYSNDAA